MSPEEVIRICKDMVDNGEIKVRWSAGWLRFKFTELGKEKYPVTDNLRNHNYEWCPLCVAAVKYFADKNLEPRNSIDEPVLYNSNYQYLGNLMEVPDVENLVSIADGGTRHAYDAKLYDLIHRTFPKENQNETRD